MLDCVDTGFIPGGLLDELPLPAQVGATRTGGLDLNKPRMRAVLAAALALAIAPGGFTVADLAARVSAMPGHDGYPIRNAAYDLRKLRGKHLADKPGRTRRYLISPGAARIISALLTLRDQVIAPLLAGVADPRIRRTPRHWTDIDRHYQALRLEIMALFAGIGIACG
jgi:DNA-binding transcriptional ArsR family regulator